MNELDYETVADIMYNIENTDKVVAFVISNEMNKSILLTINFNKTTYGFRLTKNQVRWFLPSMRKDDLGGWRVDIYDALAYLESQYPDFAKRYEKLKTLK